MGGNWEGGRTWLVAQLFFGTALLTLIGTRLCSLWQAWRGTSSHLVSGSFLQTSSATEMQTSFGTETQLSSGSSWHELQPSGLQVSPACLATPNLSCPHSRVCPSDIVTRQKKVMVPVALARRRNFDIFGSEELFGATAARCLFNRYWLQSH